MSFGLSLLAFLIILGPLILFHELGHFWAARAFGIKVDEFGIGYPPRIIKLFERNGTEFTLNWIPMGGFMKPAGEDDPDIPGGFSSSSKRARLSTLAAGPIANILTAILLFTLMYIFGAPEITPGAVILEVEEGTPAAIAGLQPEDIILAADDQTIENYNDIIEYVSTHTGEDILLQIQRGNTILTTVITPRNEWPENQGPTGIVVQANYQIKKLGIVDAFLQSFSEIGRILRSLVEIPIMAFRGQIEVRYLRPVSVVGISQLGGQAIKASIKESLLWPILELAAFISVALGVTNLLPLPALDGGRILFILIEAIRGKRVEPEREALVHFIGFVLLLASMFVFVYLDIVDPLI